MIEDAEADDFARSQMIEALVIIAHTNPGTRSAVVAHLDAFFQLDVPKPDVLWGLWAFAIADLGRAHLEPLVRRAFKQDLVSPDESTFDYFQEQLRGAVNSGVSDAFRNNCNAKLIEHAGDALSRWYFLSDPKERTERERETAPQPADKSTKNCYEK